jgi:hypothetical protein
VIQLTDLPSLISKVEENGRCNECSVAHKL